MAALHVACMLGDVALVSQLLAAGAAPNLAVRSRGGWRPLHCAAQAGSARCVQLLLGAQADPLLADGTPAG